MAEEKKEKKEETTQKKEEKKKKSRLADAWEQTLDEKMPDAVSYVVGLLPDELVGDDDALWKAALPYISYGLGRAIPDEKSWSQVADDIRTRFFAEFKRQVKGGGGMEGKGRKGAGTSAPKTPPDRDAFLRLEATELLSLFPWIESRTEDRDEVRKFLKRLSLKELKTFAALTDPEKTKFYEFRREKGLFALTDEVKGDLPKLTKDTVDALDRGTAKIQSASNKVREFRKWIRKEIEEGRKG